MERLVESCWGDFSDFGLVVCVCVCVWIRWIVGLLDHEDRLCTAPPHGASRLVTT